MNTWTIVKLIGWMAVLALACLLGARVLATQDRASIAETTTPGSSGPVLVSVPDPFADETPADCGLVVSQQFRAQNSPKEPVVAVNPVDPNHIVVSYIVDGFLTNLVRVTKDGGVTWETVFVPGLTTCTGGTSVVAGDPSLAFSGDGTTLYLASLIVPGSTAVSAVVVNQSTDGGLTWSTPKQLSPDDGLRGDMNFITTDPDPSRLGTAYIAFERHEGTATAGVSTLYFRRTDNYGKTWSPATAVYGPLPEVVSFNAKVWPTADGHLVAVFRQQMPLCNDDPNTQVDECPENNAVFAAVSKDDKGLAWDAPVLIDKATWRECHLNTFTPSAAGPGPDGKFYVYVVISRHRPRLGEQAVSLDVWRSQNGTDWKRVHRLLGNRMGLPTIAVARDGTVGMTYYQLQDQVCGSEQTNPFPPLTDVWFAQSSDMGVTWTPEKLAGPFDPSTSCYGPPSPGCSIVDYDDLQPAGPGGFAAVYEMTPCSPQSSTCPCPPRADGKSANGGLSDIFFSRIRLEGPTLTPCATPPATVAKVTGGGQITGDPLFSALGDLLSLPAIIPSASGGTDNANFGFVVNDATAPSGNLQYRDHGTGDVVKATSFTALVISDSCGSNTHARFTGFATVNGVANQPLEVEVDDCGEPGTSDTFAIRVTGPSVFYANGPKTLLGGNIQIHQ